jgi:transposase
MMTDCYAGIDTHGDVHQVALIDGDGRLLAEQAFATDAAGYAELTGFISSRGRPVRVGVEGTGSYGAQVTLLLTAEHLDVVEVDRPDRRLRRSKGKSDPIDAFAAADAARTGRATTPVKPRTGAVEALRLHKISRDSAMRDRTQTANQVYHVLLTVPVPLRDTFRQLTGKRRYRALARLRPDPTDPVGAAAKTVLRRLARRWLNLTEEITQADQAITTILRHHAPELLAINAVGPQTATQLLITAGNNPDRLARGHAAFAHLVGVAPIPASSGKTRRHRYNPAGDRHANNAYWRIAFLRAHHDPDTIAYLNRRQTEGKSEPEALRCLKRYIVRQIHPVLVTIINRCQPPTATT